MKSIKHHYFILPIQPWISSHRFCLFYKKDIFVLSVDSGCQIEQGDLHTFNSLNRVLDIEIPFEIHITTDPLSGSRQEEFVNFCLANNAKPLLIELSKGDFIHQPMVSKIVYSKSVDHILSIATEISTALKAIDFYAKRLKIEIPSEFSGRLKKYTSGFASYYEWHGKTEYLRTDKLYELCEKHEVHLSQNSLKKEGQHRFITLREFGTAQVFEERIAALTNELRRGAWTVVKQQSEYCIYDNNNFLDNGWLSQ